MLAKKILRSFLFTQVILFFQVSPPLAWGGSDLRVGGQPQVQLQFRIVIPQSLSLQIGSEDQSPEVLELNTNGIQGTGQLSARPGQIPVRVSGRVSGKQLIALTAEAAEAQPEAPETIPVRGVAGRAKSAWQRPVPAGATAPRVHYWRGSGNRTGTYSWESSRDHHHPASPGPNRVIYTLSSP